MQWIVALAMETLLLLAGTIEAQAQSADFDPSDRVVTSDDSGEAPLSSKNIPVVAPAQRESKEVSSNARDLSELEDAEFQFVPHGVDAVEDWIHPYGSGRDTMRTHLISPRETNTQGWLCVGDEVPERLRRGCSNRYIYQSPQEGE
jgi:hypothetical protein